MRARLPNTDLQHERARKPARVHPAVSDIVHLAIDATRASDLEKEALKYLDRPENLKGKP